MKTFFFHGRHNVVGGVKPTYLNDAGHEAPNPALAFTTEQQSLDVLDGINRRVAKGWFPSRPPFGYSNRRVNKRSIIETHPQNSNKVRWIFDLRANHGLRRKFDGIASL
ncbi:hypothetical protein [Aporhodopirellula aestuarii]|uniref:Uncharacterized protein n=1 Tax=Aporhodopirellula aestuarii TaxID=2950107 RepID=A0ABT0U2F1_9BACT|nr:hypothetical protein [Aporhodopirellula aestuarii]MCM2371074.1 hypothetical protein [Aporhodopirellula aestuarii]